MLLFCPSCFNMNKLKQMPSDFVKNMTPTAHAPTAKNVAIKELPVSARPRERLAAGGVGAMSDTELLAIVIGTGSRGESSLRLAERLISKYRLIGKVGGDFDELAGTCGIGPAKAAQIVAAIELGKRAVNESAGKKQVFASPDVVAAWLMPKMRDLESEHFRALILNTRNQLLKSVDIAVGSLSAAIIQPRELFKTAIRANGAAIIAAHNHPSGDVTPSREDIILTRRLAEAGRILGIEFIDHLIIGDGCWVSLKEKGYLS